MRFRSKVKSTLLFIVNALKMEKIKPIIVPVRDKELLKEKVALITGGSSGIGFAIAKAFIEAGAKVIICGTNQKKLDKAVYELNSLGRTSAKGLVCNIRNVSILNDKVNEAAALFPENRIDILVNSAGLISKHDFWNTDEEDYDSLMETNTKGTFFMCQTVARMMIKKKIRGHILNVSSSSALRPAWTPYQMSKWAVKGFTLGLADTLLPYGIIVNAIAPGQTATPMFDVDVERNIYNSNSMVNRYILPEEIASLAVFMVSGAGDTIVGDTFYMTGGSGVISMHH